MNQIYSIIETIITYVGEHWISLIFSLIIVFIFKLLSPSLSYLILKIFNFRKNKEEIKQISFYKPIKTFFLVLGIYTGIISLELPADVVEKASKLLNISIIILVANGFANMASPTSRTFKALQEKFDIASNKNAIGVLSKTIKVLIYIIAGFLVITELGYNLNGLAAGLGIGTAIIALAVQDVAKNLLGGVTILTDRIFIVGDFIEAGSYQGTVEDITFRSTRIRTLDDTQVTIPNGTLANSYIINWSRMNKRRIQINLPIDWGTSPTTLDELRKRMHMVIEHQPHVIKEPIVVTYDKITNDSLNMYIYFYIDIVPYSQYIAIRGKINEELIKLLQKENISLSYPSHSIKIEK